MTTTTTTVPGSSTTRASAPVSAALEKELRDELRTSGVLVWLDKDAHYETFVDELRSRWLDGDFPYPVCAFRGSFLELMLQLDGLIEGTGNRPLLIHMPGFNEDEIRQTPVFEHYEAGKRHRRALSTLVEHAAAGKVEMEVIAEFVDSDKVTLEAADRWLETQLSQTQGLLERFTLPELWHRLRKKPEELEAVGDIESHLRARLGISADWQASTGLALASTDNVSRNTYLRRMADWMTSWALAVEYVYDLRRDPYEEMLEPLKELPKPLIDECTGFASYLRSAEKRYYARIAGEFESLLGREAEEGSPEDLGKIDTFRFEERRFLEGALEALADERWDEAAQWASQRTPENSFWIRKEPRRGDAWQLVGVAAALGQAIDALPDPYAGAMSLEEASARYAEDVWKVDQAHRVMEQRRATLLGPALPEFTSLLERLDSLREKYRQWSNRLAGRFTDLCEKHGFLATESLQQRRIFDQVVGPWTKDGQRSGQKVALFMVDALRFEMAVGLKEVFEDAVGAKAVLKPRLAELPSVTAVGMNVLAPVHESGRLEPVIRKGKFAGFQTSQFQVNDPKTRKDMMKHHVGGQWCPMLDLKDVLNGPKDVGKQIQQASLVVIHSTAIDEVGEKGHGQHTFEATLRDIRSAMRLLRQAGVKRFVVTADHGFLMLDQTTERLKHGKKTDPSPRWRLYSQPENTDKTISVPLSVLRYEGASGHLILPRDTTVFDTGGDLPNFVHGGNSPQERIIPVLTVEHDREVGGSTTDYRIVEGEPDAENGIQGLNIYVERTQATLDFGGRAEVELALRVPGDPDVMVELHSISGRGRMNAASVVVPVGEAVDVFFHLRGDRDRRARLEVYSPTIGEQFEPCVSSRWFDVQGVGKTDSKTSDETDEQAQGEAESKLVEESQPVDQADAGLEALPEGPRKIFEYLAEYDAISEADAAQLIGSPRALRRFSRKFEDYAAKVAFEVRIEQTPQGKRYVRD